MDDDSKAGAGRAVERQAEDIARRHREDDARAAFAHMEPVGPEAGEDRDAAARGDKDRTEAAGADESRDEEDEDRGPTPV